MGPNQFPGQTLQPLPASPSGFYVGDDEFSLLQKICQNLYAIAQGGGGGGGGGDQLPIWTFQGSSGGTPTAGGFTSNDPTYAAANQLILSRQDKNGATSWFSGLLSTAGGNIQTPFYILMTGENGHVSVYQVIGVTDDGSGNCQMQVQSKVYDNLGVFLDQDYYVSFAPSVQEPPATPNISAVLTASGITPIADGNYSGVAYMKGIATSQFASPAPDGTTTPVTSITLVNGIITAIS